MTTSIIDNIEFAQWFEQINNENELIDPSDRLKEDLKIIELILSYSGLTTQKYNQILKRCPDLLSKSNKLMKLIDQEFVLISDKLWRLSEWEKFRTRRIVPYMESWISAIKTVSK